jgi:hypothetical protein
MPEDFARRLFGETALGLDVIVVEDAAAFEPVEHAALFQPSMPELLTAAADPSFVTSAVARRLPLPAVGTRPLLSDAALMLEAFAGMNLERARLGYLDRHSRSPLRILVTRRTGRELTMEAQRMLAELGYDPGDIDGYVGPKTRSAIEAFRAARGAESRRASNDEVIDDLYEAVGREPMNGHLYVRQDYIDLFDAPVAIAEDDEPLGTYFFTADNFDKNATSTGWLALTVEAEDGTMADAALSRLAIPAEIRKRISELLTPGSTLVISDAGLGWETGEGTDFIVQPR